MNTNFDIYQAVTDRIIATMEKGIIPWRKPWTGTADGAVRYASGKPYSLLNQFLLERPGEWLTWNEIKAQGGTVKKGAKAGMVVFFKQLPIKDKKDDQLHGAQGVAVQHQVGGNLLEGVGLVVGGGLLGGIHNAGL